MLVAQQLAFDDALARDESWSAAAWREILTLAPGDRITSDALHRRLGSPRGHGDAVGAVVRRAMKAGLLRGTGERIRSDRPAARGRRVDVWERTDA